MYDKIVAIGSFNPTHYGHIELLRTGLAEAEKMDIYVGKRAVNYRLPHELRINCLQETIEHEGFAERISVLDTDKKFAQLPVDQYGAILTGSDLVNDCYPEDQLVQRNMLPKLYSRFSEIIILQRINSELTDYALDKAYQNFQKVTIHKARSSVRARDIRSLVLENKDISDLVPGHINEMLKKNSHYFRDG